MKRKISAITLCAVTFIVLSGVPFFLWSTHAVAQSAVCSLLSGEAKRICQAAARISREAPEREQRSPREVQKPKNDVEDSKLGSTKTLGQPKLVGNPNTSAVVGADEGTPNAVVGNLLYVAIQGTYPPGYKPAWRSIVDKSTTVTFETESYDPEKGQSSPTRVRQAQVRIALAEEGGRVIVAFEYGVIGQLCYADVVGIGKVIGRRTQQFSLRNFRIGQVRDGSRSTIGEPCMSSGAVSIDYTGGGGLRSDPNGDLFLTLEIIGHRKARYSQVRGRSFLQEYRIENGVTPASAAADLANKTRIAQENAAREAEQRRVAALVAGYNAKFPAARARVAASPKLTPRVTMSYKGYNLKQMLLLDAASRSSNCPGSEFADLLPRYTTSENKLTQDYRPNGAAETVANAEPHERDQLFATVYVLVNKWNNALLDLSARIAICDPFGAETAVNQLADIAGDSNISIFSDEIDDIRAYLYRSGTNQGANTEAKSCIADASYSYDYCNGIGMGSDLSGNRLCQGTWEARTVSKVRNTCRFPVIAQFRGTRAPITIDSGASESGSLGEILRVDRRF